MGLHVSVYRCEHRFVKGNDATNGGISRHALSLCLINVEGSFIHDDEAPAAMLVDNNVFGDDVGRRLVKIVPAHFEDGEWKPRLGGMFGGNYGGTSDSRFREAVEKLLGVFASGPVPIHDRFE